MKGLRGLTLERVLVYGKVRFSPRRSSLELTTSRVLQLKLDRQALSLLLHTLHDLSSAETYSLQCGDPLSTSEVTAAASTLNLPFKRSSKTLSAARREEEEKRKQGLARLLVEMCLTVKPTNEGEEIGMEGERVASKEQVARLLETQAVHLDTLSVRFPISFLPSPAYLLPRAGTSSPPLRLANPPPLFVPHPLPPPFPPLLPRSLDPQVPRVRSKPRHLGAAV